MSENEKKLIDPGYHKAVAVTLATAEDPVPRYARWGWTNDGDKRRVLMSFELLEGEFAGRRLFWNGYFTKKAGERTTESLRYCGWKGNDLADIQTQELNQVVTLLVEHDEHEGKVTAKIAFVNKPGGGTPTIKIAKPMNDGDIRKFAAMMRDSVSKVPEVDGERHGSAPSQSSAPATSSASSSAAGDDWGSPPPVEDDIPF